MRKSLWIILAPLFVAIGAPTASADAMYQATFTCYPEPCASVPTAPEVTFPSPTLHITLLGAFFSVMLNLSDLPDDNYVWNLQFKDSTGQGGPANSEIAISDVINGTAGNIGQTIDSLIGPSTNEEGCLTFTSTCPLPTPPPVSTPEPGTASLMLVGIGLVLVMRERIAYGLPQPV